MAATSPLPLTFIACVAALGVCSYIFVVGKLERVRDKGGAGHEDHQGRTAAAGPLPLCARHTDAGIIGLGESGTWGQLEASAASIAKYGEYLVGKDPFPIEHHWNVMLRANHFTGGAITGAVSAIDIALWDIKGKFFNVPVYELLGGRMRHKARLYGHVKGRTIDNAGGGSGAAEGGRLHRAGPPQSAAG